MSEEKQSEIVYCPLSRVYEGLEQFIQSGRWCVVDEVICFHWDNQEAMEKCPIRIYGRNFYNK